MDPVVVVLEIRHGDVLALQILWRIDQIFYRMGFHGFKLIQRNPRRIKAIQDPLRGS